MAPRQKRRRLARFEEALDYSILDRSRFGRLLTLQEASEVSRIPVGTFWRRISLGQIPTAKRNGRRFVAGETVVLMHALGRYGHIRRKATNKRVDRLRRIIDRPLLAAEHAKLSQ